jgi:hypothetical protein
MREELSDFIILLFKEKIMFKVTKYSLTTESRGTMKYYGAPVFAPVYSAAVLATKICTYSDEHSVYIRFLWLKTRDKG